MAEKILENIDLEAEKVADKYRKYVDVYEKKSVTSKVTGRVSLEEVVALGKQLERFEETMAFMEANGGISDLGVLPKIGLDVITAAMATNPLPLIASVQVVPEEKGIVWYKDVISNSAKNGNTVGQTLLSGMTGRQAIFTAAQGGVAETVATGDGTTTDFAVTIANIPARPRWVYVYTSDAPEKKAVDDGDGNIFGPGVTGTIDYKTGAVTLSFDTAPANGVDIVVESVAQADSIDVDEIPTILTEYKSTTIETQTFALRTEIGMLKQFALQKRFGMNAEEMVARDLTTELVAVLATDAVRKAYQAAVGVVNFDVVPPAGVSQIEHKLSFKTSVLPRAQANVLDNSGRLAPGSAIVAGTGAAAYIMGLPGFKGVTGFNALGTMVIGTLDEMPVLRSTALPANEAVYITKGDLFEAGLVNATYMPLTITQTLQGVNLNPLRAQKAIATIAGTKAVIPGMITKIVFQNLN